MSDALQVNLARTEHRTHNDPPPHYEGFRALLPLSRVTAVRAMRMARPNFRLDTTTFFYDQNQSQTYPKTEYCPVHPG